MKIKKIIPIIKNCKKCNNKVKNHHFFCDKCWAKKYAKRDRQLTFNKRKKINEDYYKAKRRKKEQEKIEK